MRKLCRKFSHWILMGGMHTVFDNGRLGHRVRSQHQNANSRSNKKKQRVERLGPNNGRNEMEKILRFCIRSVFQLICIYKNFDDISFASTPFVGMCAAHHSIVTHLNYFGHFLDIYNTVAIHIVHSKCPFEFLFRCSARCYIDGQ